MAVATIAGILLINILSTSGGVFMKQNLLVGQGLGLNDVLRKVDADIKETVAVAVGYPEGSPTTISGPNILVLKLPALSSEGVVDSVYDYVIIETDSGKRNVLTERILPDSQSSRSPSAQVLTTLLDGVIFSYFDALGNVAAPKDAVRVGTQLTLLSPTSSLSKQSSTIMTSLRNK